MNLNVVECDDGGILRELYKNEGFGQITIRIIPIGQKIGGHKHPNTNEMWWVLEGKTRIELVFPKYKATIAPKDTQVIKIPAGVWHSIENIGDKEAVLLWHSDKIWEPGDKE